MKEPVHHLKTIVNSISSKTPATSYVNKHQGWLGSGFVDKNGKEIFEGDILLGFSISGKPRKFPVSFHDGSFYYQDIDGTYNPLEPNDAKNLEVIGHIAENPALCWRTIDRNMESRKAVRQIATNPAHKLKNYVIYNDFYDYNDYYGRVKDYWDKFDACGWLGSGVLDKNGVEIYEGDRVDIGDNEPPCTVRFFDGAFWLDNHITHAPLLEFVGAKLEVIGHIAEKEQ